MTTPRAAFFDVSEVADILSAGNAHFLLLGDSISFLGNNNRIPAGLMRAWGVSTAPIVGVVASPTSGPTDQWGRSFKGTSNQRGIDLKPGSGVLIAVSGGSGIFTLGEEITESVSGATGIFVEEAGGFLRILYAPGDTLDFTGGQTLTGGTSGAVRNGGSVTAATTDHLGLDRNIFPGVHGLMEASGNPGLSVNIFRSILQNTELFAQGEWTSGLDIMARGIYYSHTNAFNIKGRTYRNSVSINQANHNQQSTDNAIRFFELSCGTGSAVPCEWRWEALSGDETGQFTYFTGAFFYRPGVNTGISLDAIAVGGDGISEALNTDRSSDSHYTEYLAATKRPEADKLVIGVLYGQNDAGMSQESFQSRLQDIINRFLPLGLAAGYADVKFLFLSPYNTGGAHLSGKRDACYLVAKANKGRTAFINLYDEWTASEISGEKTTDGIHPTLDFATEISSFIAEEIANPTQTDISEDLANMAYVNIAIPAAGAAGSNELVAAVPGKRIRVTSMLLVGKSPVGAYIASDATPIACGDSITPFPLGDQNFTLSFGSGYIRTAMGESLNLVLTGDVGVVGFLTYALDA